LKEVEKMEASQKDGDVENLKERNGIFTRKKLAKNVKWRNEEEGCLL
jgi:hypothetical protein